MRTSWWPLSILLAASSTLCYAGDFCGDLNTVMGAAAGKFQAIKGAFEDDMLGIRSYTSSIQLAPGMCTVDEDRDSPIPTYSCGGRRGAGEGDYEGLKASIAGCPLSLRPGSPRSTSRTSSRGFLTKETVWEVLQGGSLAKVRLRYFGGDGGKLRLTVELME
jgi:hypothetical protein